MRISDWSSDVCSSDLAKGRPIKVDGRYLASWNAYPQPGMEEGPAVIGLAWSDDLIRWHRDDTPILRPEDGAEWERAGLYRSRSEEHTSELQSLMRISYAVFCLKKNTETIQPHTNE